MKRTMLAAILATAAIAFSCTMNEEPGALKSGSVVKNPTVTIADFDYVGPATKTTMTLSDNVAKYAFAASDVLGAFPVSPEVGECLRFTVSEQKGTSCVFTGNGFGLIEGQKYAAYYPAPAEVVEVKSVAMPAATAVPVDFTIQNQPEANAWNLSNVDFLYATGIEPANGACSFAMKHLGAMLVMDITFEKAGVYKALVLESSEGFITTGTVNLLKKATDDDFFVCEDVDETLTLTLGGDNGMAVTAGQTVTFFMMVAPDESQEEATLTLSLVDSNDKEVVVKQAKGFAFASNKAYKFGSTLYAGVNLSANGTANSYIVDVQNINDEGYYFDCTVAGNGVKVDMAGKGFASHANVWPQINGKYTSALPAPRATDIRVPLNQNNCIKDVSYADGKIFFKATGEKGNARIVIMDDVNDDPAWAWIIWCTDQPGIVTLDSFSVMDRNLGALTNDLDENNPDNMYGLYYQFGNPTGWTGSEFLNCAGGSWRMVDGIAGAAKSGKPLVSTSAVGNSAADWYWFNPYGSNAQKQMFGILWGGGSAGDATLKYEGTAVKTMYDPCPPGYKVPSKNFVIAASDAGGNSYGFYKNGTDGTLFFPYNGAVNKDSAGGVLQSTNSFGSRRGPYVPEIKQGEEVIQHEQTSYTCLWTISHNNSTMAYYLWLYAKSESSAAGAIQDRVLSYGMGIRCVAE